MALNIGNINFGIDASTVGLQKAIGQLNRFQKETDKVAKSQAKGSQAVANAMSRQESAIKKAFQQTLQLREAINKGNLTEQQRVERLSQASLAFKRLTSEMTSGKITVVEFNRSVDAFNAKMARSKRTITEYTAATAKGKRGTGKMATALRDLESSAVLALGPLSGLGARIRSVGAIIGRGQGGFTKLALIGAGAAVAFAIALIKIGSSAIRAKSELQGLQMRFEAATGSTALGNKEYEFTIKLAKKLGLELKGLARSYSRFLAASQGTNIEGAKSRKIFIQIAKAAAALKLDAADVEGVMRAIEQIMSKGTVQAEELRGQLGDRLPGAFRIAAKAMGVTTRELNKMLKAGEVISEEFLPKFGDQVEKDLGQNAARNVKTLSGAVNNLKTSMFQLAVEADKIPGQLVDLIVIGEVGDELVTFSAIFQSLINAVSGLADLGTEFSKAGDAGGVLAKSAGFVGENLGLVAEKAEPVEKVIKDLTGTFNKLNKEMEDSLDELVITTRVLETLGKGQFGIKDIDFLTDVFTNMAAAEGLTVDGLENMRDRLEGITGLDIPATAEGIAKGFATVLDIIRQNEVALDAMTESLEKTKEVDEELQTLRAQAIAFRQGPDEAQLFKDVTTKVLEYKKALDLSSKSEEERNRMLAEYKALIIEVLALGDDQKQAAADRKKDAAREASDLERASKAMLKANNQLAIMRQRMAALASGPDSLEYFEKVLQPLQQMEQRLRDQGLLLAERNVILEEYEMLLNQQFEATNRLQRAADSMAAAVTNSFEEMIIKGGDVSEMLKELGRELLRIWLRATTLDQMQSSLGSLFGGLFNSPAPTAAPNIGGGGGGSFGNNFARGGSFRLPGAGGSDKVPFFGLGKPGETVSVSRPDQIAASGGGGDINIITNNHFEGGFDANTLIPILEENNRKVKAEFLDAQDRGLFN